MSGGDSKFTLWSPGRSSSLEDVAEYFPFPEAKLMATDINVSSQTMRLLLEKTRASSDSGCASAFRSCSREGSSPVSSQLLVAWGQEKVSSRFGREARSPAKRNRFWPRTRELDSARGRVDSHPGRTHGWGQRGGGGGRPARRLRLRRGTLRVWDLESGQTLHTLEGHTDRVSAVAVVDGRRAVSASDDGTLRVWDLESGQTLKTLEGHTAGVSAVAVVDGRRAVSASARRDASGVGPERADSPQNPRRTHGWGQRGGGGGRPARRLRLRRRDASGVGPGERTDPQNPRRTLGWGQRGGGVDGRRAVSGSCDGTLRVWDLETGQTYVTSRTLGLGQRGGGSGQPARHLRLRRPDPSGVGPGERTAPQHLEGHSAWVSAVAVVDGRRAISASDDGTLRVWDLESGQPSATSKDT